MLTILLIIYASLMVMNLVFMLSLHFFHDRKGYYKAAVWIWAGMSLGFFVDGEIAANFEGVHHIFGIVFLNITTHSLAQLASDIYRFSYPRRQLVLFSVGTWLVGTMLHFVFDASFAVSALAICTGIVAPSLWASYRILAIWKTSTIIDRLFGLLLTLESLHILDYPFLRNTPKSAVFGFSFALIIMYFASMLVPVVINRRISADFTDLLQKEVAAKTLSLEATRANLMNASRLAALGEMAGGMAHEINTPLGVIKLRAGQLNRLLAATTLDVEAAKKMILAIDTTTDLIAKIIQGLRSFARNSDGYPLEDHPLSAVVEDTLNLCMQTFAIRGIELRRGAVPDVVINCRPEQISQVIINILNNAGDAVADLSEKWVDLSFVRDQNIVDILVSDSGTELSKEVAQKIFQPFFTTKPIGKGTGLGLSISKGIVEDHQGTLFLDQSRKNTCFVIRLPISALGARKALSYS